MKPTWKKSLTAAVLTVSLVTAAAPVVSLAAEGTTVVQSLRGEYALTGAIRADVKSVVSELNGDETRIAAVVRLYNGSGRVVRVPDYELRARTADGTEYTLRPSATNAKAIQAKEKTELSYMLTLDYGAALELTELAWVEVDEYVYPKSETSVLTVPVADRIWGGADGSVTDPSAVLPWGTPFTLPDLSAGLQFTPVTLIHEKTPQGPVTVVTLIAENRGIRSETVPDFRLDGKSEARTYPGQRVQANVQLKPGEKKYVHYGILTENNATLNSLNVLTPESFVDADSGQPVAIDYTVGRLNVTLPQQDTLDPSALPVYKLGDRIAFDPMSKLIDKETSISLVDLSLNESESAGYNTIVAKFLVRNTGERPVPVPAFQTELTNADGFRYTGSRQTVSVPQLEPKLSYVINYAFAVPSSETGEGLRLKLLDNQTVAPYNIPIGGFRTAVVADSSETDTLQFYPFSVKLTMWDLAAQGSMAGYTYKLKMNLDIQAEADVVADASSANMTVELQDTLGRLIASETLPFTGRNKLISGSQTIVFQNLRTDQFEWPLTVKIYESIQTANGEAKRLVKTLKQ